MGLSASAPIDPFDVCALFDIRVLPLSELCPESPFLGLENSAFSAMTVPSGWQTAIVYNDSHHRYRQRSDICHELAHCFLGHRCTPPLTPDGARAHDGGVEAEANYLGGALLVPNEAAIYIVRTGLGARAQQVYGISEAMLTYRLRVSGATRIEERRLQRLRRARGGYDRAAK
jgi:Zn-dependent peptidase ImmA (M78 family)